MLTEICAELRNYFEVPNGRHFGKFEIRGGSIAQPDFLKEGQYFRIIGFVFSDCVHQCPSSDLADEVFHGAVWSMAVSPAVIDLSAEIEEYNNSDAGKTSPYTSESFGGYAYTKATDANGVSIGKFAILKNIAYAQEWVAPYGTNGAYMRDEVYKDSDGIIWKCKEDYCITDQKEHPSAWVKI